MGAPKGNRFWEARSRHGRKPHFEEGPAGAQKLYECCCDYFAWVEDNPLYEAKLVSYEGVSSLESVPKVRAMTIGSLSLFLGAGPGVWYTWRQTREDLRQIIDWAETCIREQKFGAAAAGLLNANIISRDLGLADRQELSGPGGGPVRTITTEMTPEEAADLYARTRDGEVE